MFGTDWRMLGLPPAVESALWRGNERGASPAVTLATGFTALDAELPGGGWPTRALTEILQPRPAVAEWRLLGPVVKQVRAAGKNVALIGPPSPPHLPGLRYLGLDDLIWIRAETPAERLWTTEQLIKSNAAGLLLAWLPQGRSEQIRRLQVCAQGCESPVFLFRPIGAAHEASAAPLRLQLCFDVDWELRIRILKRRGAPHGDEIRLPSIPGGLERVLTPRLRKPSRLMEAKSSAPAAKESHGQPHVVGRLDPRAAAIA
jgi:protein ImuA